MSIIKASASPPASAAPPADLTGWPLDPRERGDFYHLPRAFPPEVATWRRHLVDRCREHPRLFRGVQKGVTVENLRAAVDAGIAYLREVARVTAAIHGTPRLGNQNDPVDELVYIILARKTREDAYQAAYTALKARFASWDELLDAPRDVVTTLVHSATRPRPGSSAGTWSAGACTAIAMSASRA